MIVITSFKKCLEELSPILSSHLQKKNIYSITRFVNLSEEPIRVLVLNKAKIKGSSVRGQLGKGKPKIYVGKRNCFVEDPEITHL